jgi:ribose transport system ATP-binding protein
LIAQAAEAGTAVVVVSTDFDEVSKICARSYVFNRGEIVAELAGDVQTAASITAAASGTRDAEQGVRA